MFNFLYIRHAFILWDIYPISYRYGFFPRPANRNLQCKLNLPIRLVLGHMSEITLKILMKSGTFGLCQNKIDGFFFRNSLSFFFFGQRILRNLILFQYHLHLLAELF